MFNLSPESPIEISLVDLINELIAEIASNIDGLQNANASQKGPEESAQFTQYLYKATLVEMTSLLLSLEQLLYNDTHSEAQNQFHGQRISINNKALCLDKNVYSQIAKFIPLLTNNSIHTHMKSTILQIMYIIMDINQGVEILYQGGLVNALADMLRISVQENRQYLTYIEQTLIVKILQKCLRFYGNMNE